MDVRPTAEWDLSESLAEIQETYLAPAMYAQWAIRLTAMAHIDSGHHVLDVGCGTGILARKAVEDVGFTGKVTGIDHDQDMIAVAARKAPNIDWRVGDPSQLPFDDESFDRVVSQFFLPHTKNRVRLLKEMMRVLKPGGRMALAVWAPLQHSPAFNALAQLVQDQGNARAFKVFATPWELGHEHKIRSVISSSGAQISSISREKGTARFPNPETILALWLDRAPVSKELDEAARKRIRLHALEPLSQFSVSTGGLVCPMDATVVTVDKR